MAHEIRFEDFSRQVIESLNDKLLIALEEAAGEIESAVKDNTKVGKVNGGNTRGKWSHWVDEQAYTAYVGNPLETAIWLEFGTGEHALNGDGRAGGWYIHVGNGNNEISQAVVDAYGFKVRTIKGEKFVHTTGMKPQRPLQKAFDKNKNKVIKHIQDVMKGL